MCVCEEGGGGDERNKEMWSMLGGGASKGHRPPPDPERIEVKWGGRGGRGKEERISHFVL